MMVHYDSSFVNAKLKRHTLILEVPGWKVLDKKSLDSLGVRRYYGVTSRAFRIRIHTAAGVALFAFTCGTTLKPPIDRLT